MFAVTVRFVIAEGQMEAFLPLILENARSSLSSEPGCHQFDVCYQGDTVFLYELYDDEAAFETHTQQPHFAKLNAALPDGMVLSKDIQTFDNVLR